MTTLYVAAYNSTTTVTGSGGPRPYAVPASSGDSVSHGCLIAYDSTLTADQLRHVIKKAGEMATGLPV